MDEFFENDLYKIRIWSVSLNIFEAILEIIFFAILVNIVF